MLIYIVVSEFDESVSIEAVFSTRELADRYTDFHNRRGEDYSVEEHQADRPKNMSLMRNPLK